MKLTYWLAEHKNIPVLSHLCIRKKTKKECVSGVKEHGRELFYKVKKVTVIYDNALDLVCKVFDGTIEL